MTDLYTLFGHPVEHSISPKIHTHFAEQTGQSMQYTKTLVPLGGFSNALQHFRDHGGCGANVTVPFKLDAFNMMDKLTPHAQSAQAVNTIFIDKNGQLIGDNTDGRGFVRDACVNKKIIFLDKRILIIGAGGAVRGLLHPLTEQGVASIHIANRTASKAKALCEHFKMLNLIWSSLENIASMQSDIIINATSASLFGVCPEISPDCLQGVEACFDLAYGQSNTVFVEWISQYSIPAWDGFGMLVEQAADAFEFWRGIRPNTTHLLSNRSAYDA